jgi:hypothetical protein
MSTSQQFDVLATVVAVVALVSLVRAIRSGRVLPMWRQPARTPEEDAEDRRRWDRETL